ncbi:type I secretion system permease/ATPase [Rhodoferax sp. GW822-FHT02A01]|uniref:type I secretion system permease/ATPase n=1 Tax=Rhodoferax sp. GW822-FHT02A01 TaxID=3141537 RepID=UPI00315D41EC
MNQTSATFVTPASSTDELLECLLIVARSHGESPTRETVMSGLPAQDARLSPALFERAAKRARLSSRLAKTPLDQLKDGLLPAIVLMEHKKACVLLGFSEDRSQAQVVYPELPDAPVSVPLDDLNAQYLGTTIYARPAHRFDARTPQVRKARQGHWFWSVMAESRPLYMDVLFAALLANLFALGMPLFTMNVYDRVVPNHAFETLWVLAFGLLLMLLGDLVLRTMRSRFVDLASSRVDVKLSAFIMERVLGTRMEQRPASAGSFASNLRAFESVRDFIGSATVVAFIDLPFSLIFMVTIAWISWMMLIPLVVGSLIMLLYSLAVQDRMHELAETTYRASAQRNATLIEGLVGFETIKALSAESNIQTKWEKSAALLARVGAQLRLLSSTAASSSAFVQQLVNLAIVVIGVYAISEKELTMGGLIACTMLASRAMAPVGQVAGLLVQFHTASTALTSLDEMMKRDVERPADANYINRGRLQGAIDFRGVSFTYPGQTTPSLQNLNFRIKPGEKVAILGRIGSGKTTLEKLILGLYQPTEGAVLVDGIDLRQLDPAELRSQIGYVQQDIMLFYGTLRENITLGAPLASHQDIVRAAEIGGVINLVNQHPQGFDMLVGERGESLSGGQRQGVAIARAVINDPPILLLDEPTSSMDYSSEEDIKRRITEFAHDKTVILISHRTALLDLVDRIIVMDGGRIVADGPKEQVVTALRQGRIGKAA